MTTGGRLSRGATVRAAAIALFAGALSAGSADARPLDKVRESGVLVVAVYRDFAPWSYVEEGEAKGIDVAIGRLLAAALGVRAEFMVRMAGEDVDTDLRANVWRGDIVERRTADVMLHVPVDPNLARRNDLVTICCRYGEERMSIAFDPEVITTRSFATFRRHKVAVEVDATADIWLSAAFNGVLGANLVRGRTFSAAVETFRSGAAAALVAPRAQLEWAVRGSARPVTVEEWPMPGVVASSWPIGLAVKFDSRDLGHALDAVLEAARADGRLKEIHGRWGVTWIEPKE
jgi:ABC-type amino acid transport substrate-binding protein